MTGLGALAALFSTIVVWVFVSDLTTNPAYNLAMLMFAGLGLLIYAVMDQLDGLQAKRSGQSSSFGDFFDHWVDAIMANLGPIPIMINIGFSPTAILCLATLISLTWWTNNWETRNLNRRKLPAMGGLELILLGVALLGFTAVWGPGLWGQTLFGMPFKHWVFWSISVFLLSANLQSFRRTKARAIEFFGLPASLLPLGGIMMQSAGMDSGYLVFCLSSILFGLTAAQHTGALMLDLWLRSSVSVIDPWFMISGWSVLVLFLFLQSLSFGLLGYSLCLIFLIGIAIRRLYRQAIVLRRTLMASGN